MTLSNSMGRTFSLPLIGTKPHFPYHLHTISSFPNSWQTRVISSIFINPNKTTSFYGLTNSDNIIGKSCSHFGIPPFSVFPLHRSCSSSLWFSVTVMSQNNDHPNALTTSQDSIKTVRCVIKGRVQGVFYRNWTIQNATQLGLKGWVRNRRDGSVEALFSGNTQAVDEMMQRCRRGPPDAMVTAFQAHPCNEDTGDSFQRRPTV